MTRSFTVSPVYRGGCRKDSAADEAPAARCNDQQRSRTGAGALVRRRRRYRVPITIMRRDIAMASRTVKERATPLGWDLLARPPGWPGPQPLRQSAQRPLAPAVLRFRSI